MKGKNAQLTLIATATALFVALAVLLPLAAGCGTNNVRMDEEGKSMTVRQGGESATLEMPQTAPSEAELGVPVYPGAVYDAENSARVNYSSEAGAAYIGTARFLADDGLETVQSWYRDRLGAPDPNSPGGTSWLIGSPATGDFTVVNLDRTGGKTRITINRTAATVN